MSFVVRVIVIKPITVKRNQLADILTILTQTHHTIHAFENYRLCATTTDVIAASPEESMSIQGDVCALVVKAISPEVFDDTIARIQRRYSGFNWLGKNADLQDNVLVCSKTDRMTEFFYSAIFSRSRGWPKDIKGIV